jgi:hypothetical protein
MLASLDVIAILKRELSAYKCPASSVASLAGVSGGRLSAFFKEQARPTAEQDLALREAWRDIKRLVELAKPLSLDLKDFPALRDSIKAMRENRLQIVVYQTDAEHNSSATNPANHNLTEGRCG